MAPVRNAAASVPRHSKSSGQDLERNALEILRLSADNGQRERPEMKKPRLP